MLLRGGQFAPQPGLGRLLLRQLRRQLGLALLFFRRLSLRPFPALGFLRERCGQLPELRFHFRLRRLQFRRPGFELGLLRPGILLLGLQLLLGRGQLPPQLFQLCFQFALLLIQRTGPLLGSCATLALFRQRGGQALDLLFRDIPGRLKFFGLILELGLFALVLVPLNLQLISQRG